MKKMKMNKKTRRKLIILSAATVIIAGVLIFEGLSMRGSDKVTPAPSPAPTVTAKPIDYGDFTFPAKGERPYAVMIDNATSRVLPQGGLNKAQLIYEILAEGGETRYMAVFWGKGSSMIGPVRSSRHYFLDFAMEHNAIYVHYGWSPYAKSDISAFGINNINGLFASGTFWDITTDKYNWQDSYTSTSRIKAYAKEHKYSQKTTKGLVFSYRTEDIVPTGGKTAKFVEVDYNSSHYSSYKYNSKTKMYMRYRYGVAQMERVSGKQVATKNIIIQKIAIASISNDAKGRQALSDVGSGSGWYISCGKALKLNWSKASRSAQTKYTLSNGDALVLNPGQTWIQIVPISCNPTISKSAK